MNNLIPIIIIVVWLVLIGILVWEIYYALGHDSVIAKDSENSGYIRAGAEAAQNLVGKIYKGHMVIEQ